MNIKAIQEKIDKTEYTDMLILDVQIKYFGDDIDIYIENDEYTCWKITLLGCYKVGYETDANWRGNFRVKETGPQSGYFGQDISVKQHEEDQTFVDVAIDLSIMTMQVICKDISVEDISLKDVHFFWQDT